MDVYQNLFAQKRLSCLSSHGDFLPDFVESFPSACHVRDACSEKYLMVNQHMVDFCGLQLIDDIIGITRDDLWIRDTCNRRRRQNLDSVVISREEACAKFSEKIESQALLGKCSTNTNLIGLNSNGTVIFDNITKIPIISYKGRVIAFLSIFVERTRELTLDKLFECYQGFYPKKKAIHQLLKHLRLNIYFDSSDSPTYKEIQVLFAMREDSRYKAVARKLSISVATASNHVANLQEKLLKPFDIHNILIKLRAIPVNEQISAYDHVS